MCVHSVARYTRAGLLPCLRINRRVVRYDPAVVRAFIQSANGGAQIEQFHEASQRTEGLEREMLGEIPRSAA